MIIDCDACTAGPRACADCVVTFLTIGVGEPPAAASLARGYDEPAALLATAAPVVLDPAEERALGVLAEGGLVPPLRMERAV